MRHLIATLALGFLYLCAGCGKRSSPPPSPPGGNSTVPAQAPQATFKGVSNHYEAKDPQ